MSISAADLHAMFEAHAEVVMTVADYNDFAETSELLAQVADELNEQDIKWGEQNHPFVTFCEPGHWQAEADAEKASNDLRAEHGDLDWRGILLEEVYEALAEDDADKACVELIQVAAVCISTIKSIRRNGLEGK